MSAKYGDWTRGEDEALLNKLGGVEVARNILKGTVEVVTKVMSYIINTFTFLVDETISVEEAVKLGKFDWFNDDITSKTFPKAKDGKKENKETAVFHFNRSISSEDAITEMDKAGYKPATIGTCWVSLSKSRTFKGSFPLLLSVLRARRLPRCGVSLRGRWQAWAVPDLL